MLALRGKLSLLIVGVAALLLAVAAAIPSAALWLQDKGETVLPGWLRGRSSVRETFQMLRAAPSGVVHDPRLILELTALNFIVFVADAATLLLCLLALGERASFEAAFVAFTMAAVVTLLSAIPLGSFEATAIGMLRLMGVPFETALSGTLLYRGLALWLPLGLGAILARRTMRK
jgi:uncharacterized protein (TIRG00374 family)